MEKLSLYDLFSTVLPGVVALFIIQILSVLFHVHLPLDLLIVKDNDLLTTTYVLVLSLFTGTTIHWLSHKVTKMQFFTINIGKFYRRIFANYKRVSLIFLGLNNATIYLKLINEECNKKFHVNYGNEEILRNILETKNEIQKQSFIKEWTKNHENQELFFTHIYYFLEQKEQSENTRAFQSYYFLFRNNFNVLLFASILIILLFIINLFHNFHIKDELLCYFLIACIFGSIISLELCKWYRKRMIEKFFISYYTYITSNQKN